jgi:xanthine dehydrogenase accessory factor
MYRKLADFLGEGDTVCLATVIRARGSVPREVAAKMIIHPQGRHAGTVGGGCGEAAVMRTALDVLSTGAPAIISVDLTGEVTMESPAICGGVMDVFIERIPSPRFSSAMLQALLDAATRRKPASLTTVVAAPEEDTALVGNKVIARPESEPLGLLGLGDLDSQALLDAEHALRARQHKLLRYAKHDRNRGTRTALPGEAAAESERSFARYTNGSFWCFTEVLASPPTLVIVGAGHIAQPLAEVGRLCGFGVTVLDDRAQFANRQRFPQAEKVLSGPMPQGLSGLPLDRDTYVVLITRGHQHDVECLLEIMDVPLAYVGMIGSRRRVRGVFELLEKERRIPREKLQRVFAPIGLDIGAKTPAEIAVAIMAEVIKVHRGGKVPSLSDDRRNVASSRGENH